MDYVEHLMNYVDEDIGEIVEEYLGPYCMICGQTYVNEGVRTIHDGNYEYTECIDKTNCIVLEVEVKSKKNPWHSTRNLC